MPPFKNKVCVKMTTDKGAGVFAKENIKKGEIILRRVGRIMQVENISKTPKYIQSHWFPISKDKYLMSDPPAKYLNHSCDPNAGIINDKDLVAMKDIKSGEEIAYDYAMVGVDSWTMECHCGAKNCRKIIGRYEQLDPKTKKKYEKYVPDWVKK